MNLAGILKEIGNEGLFQIVALLILAMPKMPMQWSMTMMSYAAYEPEWCCVPEHIQVDRDCAVHFLPGSANASVISYKSTYGKCHLNSTICSKHVYLDPDGASTAVTEWDLVCDHQWIVSSLSSIQMGGVLVGALITGFVSDVFGRKKVHFATIFIHALLNLGAGFSNTWILFAVFRFFIGAAIGGYLVVHVPYVLEFLSPRWRVIPASLPFGSIGASLLPLAAWLLPDWRWMHFICAILCVPFLFGYCFMPESMRWLTVKGKVNEAAKVVDQIARMNKREYNQAKCLKKMQKIAEKERELKEKGKKYTYLDVYRGWKMARLTLTLQYVWFTTSLVGYGIILGVSSLAGNVYVNMFLVEAVEIPFIMATSYFSNCIGRRYTALIYFCLATITAFLAFIFHLVPSMPNRDTSITIMCICCRTFIAGAAAVFIVVSTEVYPTVIRTLGYGAANTAAKVGGVLSPFLINMDSLPTVSYSVMFVTCLLCVLAVLSLQETKNMLMEDTLERKGSKMSLMSSLSTSLDQATSVNKPVSRSASQSRIIIDFDTDLIHHRSYSEFEDDDDDDDDDTVDTGDKVQMVEDVQKKKKEKTPLMRNRASMYDPSLASDVQVPSGDKTDSLAVQTFGGSHLNNSIAGDESKITSHNNPLLKSDAVSQDSSIHSADQPAVVSGEVSRSVSVESNSDGTGQGHAYPPVTAVNSKVTDNSQGSLQSANSGPDTTNSHKHDTPNKLTDDISGSHGSSHNLHNSTHGEKAKPEEIRAQGDGSALMFVREY